ncbi:MAG: GNAT family N-acetyltransferase [Candidatus Heimdallarchaeaceae archaeon]
MTSTVLIRQAELADINSIIKINRVCLPENYSFDFFYRIMSEYGFACAVGEEDGEIAGYVLSRIERPFSSMIGLQNIKGHIISIAVLPQYRRKKIGLELMKFVMRRMLEKEIYSIYLEVRKSNIPAIKLYQKLNFKEKKELKHYYRDGESAILMEWNGQTIEQKGSI